MTQRLTRKRMMDIGRKVMEHHWAAILQVAEDENLPEDTVIRATNLVMFDEARKQNRKLTRADAPTEATDATASAHGEEPQPKVTRKRNSKKAKKGGG